MRLERVAQGEPQFACQRTAHLRTQESSNLHTLPLTRQFDERTVFAGRLEEPPRSIEVESTVGRRELPRTFRDIQDALSGAEAATAVGGLLAERAKAAGVSSVVFDRGGYKYHGRVRALAEAARESGLEF